MSTRNGPVAIARLCLPRSYLTSNTVWEGSSGRLILRNLVHSTG